MKAVSLRNRASRYDRACGTLLVALGLAAVVALGFVARAAMPSKASITQISLDNQYSVFDPFELRSTPPATNGGSSTGSPDSLEARSNYCTVPPICIPDRPQCRSPYKPPWCR
jgi:hypothetical protein